MRLENEKHAEQKKKDIGEYETEREKDQMETAKNSEDRKKKEKGIKYG